MDGFYNKIYYDRFVERFVTEKEEYAAPERYLTFTLRDFHNYIVLTRALLPLMGKFAKDNNLSTNDKEEIKNA